MVNGSIPRSAECGRGGAGTGMGVGEEEKIQKTQKEREARVRLPVGRPGLKGVWLSRV